MSRCFSRCRGGLLGDVYSHSSVVKACRSFCFARRFCHPLNPPDLARGLRGFFDRAHDHSRGS